MNFFVVVTKQFSWITHCITILAYSERIASVLSGTWLLLTLNESQYTANKVLSVGEMKLPSFSHEIGSLQSLFRTL